MAAQRTAQDKRRTSSSAPAKVMRAEVATKPTPSRTKDRPKAVTGPKAKVIAALRKLHPMD